jgi:hypothetical protein
MGQMQYEPESSENSAKNWVREPAADLAPPEFDSLPATAGLTNTEAFRLSLRHALTLLPAMLDRRMARGRNPSGTERFRLD